MQGNNLPSTPNGLAAAAGQYLEAHQAVVTASDAIQRARIVTPFRKVFQYDGAYVELNRQANHYRPVADEVPVDPLLQQAVHEEYEVGPLADSRKAAVDHLFPPDFLGHDPARYDAPRAAGFDELAAHAKVLLGLLSPDQPM